jgi:hypothetical protein
MDQITGTLAILKLCGASLNSEASVEYKVPQKAFG